MIYNDKIIDETISDYRKVDALLNLKKYILYCSVVFLLSRVNILFYMAPIGIVFSIICVLKSNKILGTMICLSSMIGYFSISKNFVSYDLYIIINIFLMILNFIDIKKSHKKILILSLVGIIIYSYKYFFSGFSLFSSLFSVTTELSIIVSLYFVFNNFINVMSYFNTNQIFVREEVVCLVISICLVICGFNGFKIFLLDITNMFLIIFILVMSYVNGMSVGMICAVFSGIIVGIIYGEPTQYIAIYSLMSCVSSLLYLSSRFSVVLLNLVCIFILKLSTISFISINENLLLIEVFVSMIIFMVLPNKFLNKILVYFNEDHKKEFYTQKRLFNTLDMRIQKINYFNDIIKQLSDMIISNGDFRYRALDKKIYIEILAESVCGTCKSVNKCWRDEVKTVRDKLLVSLDNFIQGNKNLDNYIDGICIQKHKIMNELSKISNFYNMQKVYEEKIYEAQDMISYELKSIHNVIEQSVKEVKKDIVVKVNLEKSLISKFNKFHIKYFDLVCYEENGRIKVKIILPKVVYDEYKFDILDIINLALSKQMILKEESSQHVNTNEEVVLNYVERYDFNIISHCLQLSKKDKNGDNYIVTKNVNDDYIIILSDGIGSGSEAYDKSKFTVDIIHKFIKTSLSLSLCIKEIISIISLKFFRDESISTIDFASIDLYSGKMNYLKVSSVITYVKRGDKVFVLESEKNLFNEGDSDNDIILTGDFDLEYGDILVHLTDGLIHFGDLSSKAWLYNFLKKIDIISPDKLCEEIIREFKILNKGSFKDDVTVIVSKAYKNC